MNRARAALSALFAWAIARGLADTSPVQGTPKAAEKPRERVLSLSELRQIWAATDSTSDHDVIVRLAILLGQRRDEIGGLRGTAGSGRFGPDIGPSRQPSEKWPEARGTVVAHCGAAAESTSDNRRPP